MLMAFKSSEPKPLHYKHNTSSNCNSVLPFNQFQTQTHAHTMSTGNARPDAEPVLGEEGVDEAKDPLNVRRPPIETKWYQERLEFHSNPFDCTRMAPDLALSCRNYCVTQNAASSGHKCCYGTVGFNKDTGSHYMSYTVINPGPNHYIMFGFSDGTAKCACSFHPGYSNCPGVSLHLADGHKYYQDTNSPFISAQVAREATNIGMLINTDHRTASFFVDGRLVGVAAGKDVLTANTYYPVVALYELGQSVAVDKIQE